MVIIQVANRVSVRLSDFQTVALNNFPLEMLGDNMVEGKGMVQGLGVEVHLQRSSLFLLRLYVHFEWLEEDEWMEIMGGF